MKKKKERNPWQRLEAGRQGGKSKTRARQEHTGRARQQLRGEAVGKLTDITLSGRRANTTGEEKMNAALGTQGRGNKWFRLPREAGMNPSRNG